MTKPYDIKTELEDDTAKTFPQLAYEGAPEADEDTLDYVKLSLKGVRLG
jgi:hypothetical protein